MISLPLPFFLQSNSMTESIIFSIEVILPVLCMILIGFWLRKIELIDLNFIKRGSNIVFKVALPAMLLVVISRAKLDWQGQTSMLLVGIVCTFLIIVITWLITRFVKMDRATAAICIQGSYRANLGVTGVAYVSNAYGAEGLAKSALFLGVVTILYNLIAVILLNRNLAPQGTTSALQKVKNDLLSTAKNPMILSIVTAIVISSMQLNLPELVYTTSDYLAQLALPLAMLLTGASVSTEPLNNKLKAVMIAAVGKTIILPMLALLIGMSLNIRGEELGILFLMLMSPAAAVSFVMVQSMNGDGPMAARIIAVTSFMSIFFGGLAFSMLDFWGLIR